MTDLLKGLIVPDGWTIEELKPAAIESALLQTPDPNRFMATIDFRTRLFRSGMVMYGGSVLGKKAKKYRGLGWRQRLVDDAIAWLETI